MNKEWDKDKGGRDAWMTWLTEIMTESMRVLKAGGHGLVWALPRTSHWTAMALEDAGFEIRDCVYHIQGQGFPKSLNISKALDKKFGAERKVVGKSNLHSYKTKNNGSAMTDGIREDFEKAAQITAPATDIAKTYDGYGTALKPAVECWWLIRKPFKGSTVDNVIKNGCGGINIDKSRIATEDKLSMGAYGAAKDGGIGRYEINAGEKQVDNKLTKEDYVKPQGRFPANLIHDGSDAVMQEFAKYGESKSSDAIRKNNQKPENSVYQHGFSSKNTIGYDDNGSVARFFYCSKASVSERNTGLDGFEEKDGGNLNLNIPTGSGNERNFTQKNNHPTVKSVKLMSYLVNLIAPPYQCVVLDPFMGSGSTGIAALLNNHNFLGIEMQEDYMEIASARIDNYEKFRKYL